MITPAAPAVGPVLSARTRVEYDRDWALFADWCAAADLNPLPAEPGTIAMFLAECPAAPATQRRRGAAIDRSHRAAGLPPPTDDPAVRVALGRPEPATVIPIDAETLAAALRMLPSHGWTVGLFGRRDRALLVLTAAGIDSRQLAAATLGDLAVGEGNATFTNGFAVTTLHRRNDDPVRCGPCAIARWLRLLRLIATTHSHRWAIDKLHHSPEVTPASPHQCLRPVIFDGVADAVPLLPRIDQWGYLDTVLDPVRPRSLTTLSRQLLDGRPAAHRFVPPPADPGPTAEPAPAPRLAGGAGVYGKQQWQEALQRRRLQNQQAAEIDRMLAELERKAKDLLERSRQTLSPSET